MPHSDLLAIYLNDHAAASAGAAGLTHRIIKSRPADIDFTVFEPLAEELADDRTTLLELMGRVGVVRTRYKEVAGAAAERIGRLKLNGSLVHRSPLSSVVELEALSLAIAGTRTAWRTLRMLADTDSRLDAAQLDALIARADRQLDIVERLRRSAAQNALAA
jgi:hypothetical protein